VTAIAHTVGKRRLVISKRASRVRRVLGFLGHSVLFLIATSSVFIVLFIFFFILADALPFFRDHSLTDLFNSSRWYPSNNPPIFGARGLFFGSFIVTTVSILLAVPIGVLSAACLSDIAPFQVRQWVKPVIELLAAIPSVAVGFFAFVIFAPLLQEKGGAILVIPLWLIGLPVGGLIAVIVSELLATLLHRSVREAGRAVFGILLFGLSCWGLYIASGQLWQLEIASGRNALNVSIFLAIMALPTIVSVSEDALQSVGRELREASYALGATRAETMLRVVMPAAASGITAAVILGMMRAVGETMLVWMASGNASHIPEPWYDLTQPVRTLTATIAGDMGEADQMTGSARYHALFVLALALLTISYLFNLISELMVKRSVIKRAGGKKR
jgi:phosphate transport system permease protein